MNPGNNLLQGACAGLPQQDLPLGLLSFNVGVELGRLAASDEDVHPHHRNCSAGGRHCRVGIAHRRLHSDADRVVSSTTSAAIRSTAAFQGNNLVYVVQKP